MGLLSGKDIFSSKWITAEITDSSNHIYYVPIKIVLGDYFLTEIENQLYCFKIDGSRVKTYRHTLIKSFRVLQYDTNHYLPITAKNNTELEQVLRENALPKVDSKLLGIFKVLGKREEHFADKQTFTPHDLQSLVEEAQSHKNEYSEQVQNLTNYLEHLHVNQIVTPVKKVSEFLEDDLLTTDPRFLGTIISGYQRTDAENKKMTNTPIAGKGPWLKLIIILMIVAMVGGIGYYVYSSGMLNNLTNFTHIGGTTTQPTTTQDIMKQYPTPEALKAAVDRGDLKMDALPKEVQDMIKNYHPPVATPIPPGQH